ncbi:roundabout homolog 3 isoform X5 [Cynoglossus semilaevis]|uniref:Roundabout, axon guidance receptor, homolog 3 (Drosophila) n=1 Tax=Cynoglossus semilaevis TaxID=244447 RepID=A0A3P8WRD8_CYNSE|nr:roundabout homolog 3 isoform X5 [Cynoglossus semilaevis]
MLRYLIKTLLQMNLFSDTMRNPSNGTDLFYNMSLPSFNSSLLDWGNFTGFNGSRPRLEDAPPRIIEHPSDLIVSKGEPATLNCKAEGRPAPVVEWYKDGERVETDREDPRSHRMLLPSGSLFFLRIVHGRRSKPDEGVYVCVARNYLGEAVSRNASLEVAILRDDFRQTPMDVVVAAGEPAVMECLPPRGHPEPTISWKRNNIRVNDRDERITMRGGKLMISNTRKSDAGMYVCVGTNMVGEKDSDPAELVVFERPMFTKQPVNQIVLADDTVDFFCEVHGDPTPTVRWRREEGELPRGRFEIRSDNSLRLTQVRAEDEGTYTCVSENSVGRAEASGTLQVHVAPQIVIRPRDQITAPGRTVTFLCSTKGNPPPAVFWQKEGSQMLLFPTQEPSQSGRFSVSLSGELTIVDVQVKDSGYYICQAINVAGSILTKALLEVESAPSDRVPPIIRQGPANHTLAPGSTAQLHCHIMGNPIPSIQWEKDGQRILGNDGRISLMENGTFQITNLQETDSGVYTCLASSSSGETSWSGVLTVKESADSSTAQTTEPFQLPGPPHKPIVTDVSKNSVSLTWQPNAHEGGAAVTSYIIEAFSQSAGSKWQTVADMIKMETHTITSLLPNTIYLFIVRAVNAYGLSDPSPISEPVRTQDVSPTGQGVDHRQVQRELGEVAVQLQEPVTLTSASVRVSWTVDRQSQYVQGYRLFYRPSGGSWLLQDINSPSERSTVLSSLFKGTEYEIKIRPYFDEFQGKDSRTLLVRTTEEVPSAPPRAVTAATVKLSNSSGVSVSWEPPPNEMQNGVIQEYKVWCVGSGGDNQTRYYVNRTVDGNTLSTVLKGLMPGVLYQVEVAAVTGAGVGTHSQPVSVLIKLPAELPSMGGEENGAGSSDGDEESSVSLAEQITDVVKQPAFIAGIGGACWVILMGFSVWIYCRRKKRKELSHYAASFAYTPAVGFPHGETSGLNGRPGVLGGSMGNYPWLADSWPTTNLVHSGKEAMGCCTTNHDTAERYYNEAGISNYLNQTEKYSMGGSTEGPIYSTIDATNENLNGFTYAQDISTAPYASTSIMPFTNQAQPSSCEQQQDDAHWIPQAGPSGAQYAQPDRCTGKPRQKAMGKAVKTPSLTWMDALPPPPPIGDLDQCEQEEEHTEHEDMDLGSEEDWCPPLPERTYLMEGCEDGPSPPQRNNACSPATSYSHQSTATLTPSPHEENQAPSDLVRPNQLDGAQFSRRLPCGPVPVPQAPSPPLTQSNPNPSGQQHHGSSEVGTLQCQSPAHRCLHSQGPGLKEDTSGSTTPVHSRSSPADTCTPPSQKSRVKKKASKNSAYRRDIQGDLPPPPEPPPEEDRLLVPQGCTETSNSTMSSLERSECSSGSHQRKGSAQRHAENEDMMLYGGKACYLSRSQMSSNCSTTGSSSSRGSTGSRGLNNVRKHSEEMR